MSNVEDILKLLEPDYNSSSEKKTVTRNGEFYHGTNRELVPGDHVLPWRRLKDMGLVEGEAPHGGSHLAWAHTDPEEASAYGSNVYKVSGSGDVLDDGRVRSKEGFRVEGRHGGQDE